jgi:hypothetical protein
VVLPGGIERHGDPVAAEVAGELVALLNTDATTASLGPDGVLAVGFGEVRLVVEPDDMYEAWQLRAGNGLLLVGVPGGDVAIWTPDQAV